MKTIFAARTQGLFDSLVLPNFTPSEDYRLIDGVLSDESIIMELARDIPNAITGRNRTPVERTLRFLVLKHQRQLDYRGLAHTLAVNLEDRWFCKYAISEETPCFKTIQNQLAMIKPETIKRINDRVIEEAQKRKFTKGSKMRVDSTITKANIHYPTDSRLITDGIRIISRIVKKLDGVPRGFRTFKKTLKRQMNLMRSIGRTQRDVKEKILRELVRMGAHVVVKTASITDTTIGECRDVLTRVIAQTKTVLKGMNPKNRIVSIVEPWARPFCKGKAETPWEFGSEVQVQEDAHFVTNWQINQTSSDTAFLKEAIEDHKDRFGKPPKDLATDRGYWSPENYAYAAQCGIANVSMPKKGKLTEEEHIRQSAPRFKKGQRYRAGGEAKISLLKRMYGLGRALYKGEQGMGRWVGAGILACNLVTFARLART